MVAMPKLSSSKSAVSGGSLIVPLLLLVVLSAMLVARLGALWPRERTATVDQPQTVTIAPRRFSYRSAGEFYKGGYAVDGPMVTRSVRAPLVITKYQISEYEYGLCVDDRACAPSERTAARRKDFPVVGVSYDDAQAYATWLSRRSGETWHLPTDEETAFAAGSRFSDDALGVDAKGGNPALRWLADYRREAGRKASANPMPQRRGTYAENEFGLADFAGNVWEWTKTCNRRVDLDDDGAPAREVASCGIYLAVGRHRAPMSAFVRDPKGGGCSVGTPPDNLGFRLVKETRWYFRWLRPLLKPAVD
jgi:formylglycine-generating enzyme required for sulfatase activity